MTDGEVKIESLVLYLWKECGVLDRPQQGSDTCISLQGSEGETGVQRHMVKGFSQRKDYFVCTYFSSL